MNLGSGAAKNFEVCTLPKLFKFPFPFASLLLQQRLYQLKELVGHIPKG